MGEAGIDSPLLEISGISKKGYSKTDLKIQAAFILVVRATANITNISGKEKKALTYLGRTIRMFGIFLSPSWSKRRLSQGWLITPKDSVQRVEDPPPSRLRAS